MTQQFFVPGQLPGLNEIIAAAKVRQNGWYKYALMKEEWDTIIRYEIKRAKLKPVKRTAIHCVWQEKNQRRNPDNVACAKKFLIDSLVQSKIIPNDGWSEIAGFTDEFVVDPTQPGVLVTLR